MLDSNKIREAERNVQSYLQDGLLKKTKLDSRVIGVFVQNAKESLHVAQDIEKSGSSSLWVIVCSYYSMFYFANAALMKSGYKVGDKIAHKVTSDALIVFIRGKLRESMIERYEETREEALSLAGIKADALLESFEFERSKRGVIQYETDEINKRSKAETSLARAKEFSKEMEILMLER